MGRIKSTMVKRAAEKLIQAEHSFTESFDNNKKLLGGNTMPSKPIRNKIAGYIARMIRMQNHPRAIREKPIVSEQDSRPRFNRY